MHVVEFCTHFRMFSTAYMVVCAAISGGSVRTIHISCTEAILPDRRKGPDRRTHPARSPSVGHCTRLDLL
jgi:hypothetical protein